MKKSIIITIISILTLSCASIELQADTKSLTFLTIGSGLDLVSTLHVLGPNVKEGNPLLSFGGRTGLSATKIAITSAVLLGLHSINRTHPKLSKTLGYIGGSVFTSLAIHNLQLK